MAPTSKSQAWGLTFVAAAAMLCILINLVNSMKEPSQFKSANTGGKPKKQPKHRLEMGSLVFEHFSEETQYFDKLRLSKAYDKYVMSRKIAGSEEEEVLGSRKLTRIVELVRCDNLTLDRPEMRPMLGCLPLSHQIGIYTEGRISARAAVEYPEGDYTLRISARHKNVLGGITRQLQISTYPLNDDFVDAECDSIRKKHLQQVDCAEGEGLYVEVHSYLTNFTEDFSCSGIVTFTHDSSSFERPITENFFDGLSELLSDIKNGHYLFGLTGWTCSSPNSLMSLHSDFSIIKAKEFPYISVRHSINTKPLASIWTYSGTITQTPQDGGDYETRILIDSSSSVIEWLNFDLVQVFEHGNRFTEAMLLKASNFIVHVAGSWDLDKAAKILTLFLLNPGEKIPITNDMFANNRNDMQISFSNLEPKVYKMTVTINRNLVDDYLWGSKVDTTQDESVTRVSVDDRDEL